MLNLSFMPRDKDQIIVNIYSKDHKRVPGIDENKILTLNEVKSYGKMRRTDTNPRGYEVIDFSTWMGGDRFLRDIDFIGATVKNGRFDRRVVLVDEVRIMSTAILTFIFVGTEYFINADNLQLVMNK